MIKLEKMQKNIKYVKGDLLKSDVDIIVHCANCFCTMGSGIAKQIREQYPEAYEADLRTKKGDIKKLGSYSVAESKDKWIVNLYGQYTYGRESRKVNYEAVYNALEKLRNNLISINNSSAKIGFPYKMCCNLAGGDWRIIETMIKVIFENTNFKIEIYEYGAYK